MKSPPARCSLEGCDRLQQSRGYCKMHAKRDRRYGSPLIVKRVHSYAGIACAVDGCETQAVSNSYCRMHKDLWYKNGDPLIRINGRRGEGTTRKDGYRQIRAHGHPLADSRGQLLEHRKLLYDRIGPGPHECHWCSKQVRWETGISATSVVVDHVDSNRANNTAENLVPSCNACNLRRSRRHQLPPAPASGARGTP
jgi:hypothetical protein